LSNYNQIVVRKEVDLIDRNVGAEVIKESLVLATALSLGAAVSKANAIVKNAQNLREVC
jgi:hypothetical protein